MKLQRTHPSLIAVHLDFKGVMFRPSYIPQLLADLASQRVNAVVVEYEDIFPFEGIDIALDQSVTWSRRTLRTFLDHARRHRIEVIPLQQCLGHLEYVFRWNRYRHLALDRKYPSTVNVANPAANRLIFGMLREMIEAHTDSRFVHLGMDEAHALVTYAKAKNKDVVGLFLDHLAKLCDLCEAHGKTPIIWSDMLEDHISPASLKRFNEFKDRVILCPWDYGSSGNRIALGRIAGFRFSREWLNEPDNPDAPTIGGGNTFIEDIPAPVRKIVAPYIKGRWFTPMFQADMWTRLGFRVIGATAIRSSANLAVVPFYNKHTANIETWGRAASRAKLMGVIATSWARGTSWCPPGHNIDLSWPLVARFARVMGGNPGPFFPGVPSRTLDRLVKTIGRCRADWRIEGKVIEQMRSLRPKLTTHRYEWDSLLLMMRTLVLHRRIEYALAEVEFFHANNHPVDSEWQRRLDDQAGCLRDIARLRREVRTHFRKRYHGEAFEEWLRDLFDLHEMKLKECQRASRKKLKQARRIYARQVQPAFARRRLVPQRIPPRSGERGCAE